MKENQPEQISRRRLLKALTAAGGALAASLLPGEWAKPVVEVGVLPAHAQVTGPAVYRIDCASDPLAGNIYYGEVYCIELVAARLVLVSGAGPVSGVTVTVNCDQDWLFPEAFPEHVETDEFGLASFANFGPLCGSEGLEIPETFSLLFSCEDPVNGGTITGQCGPYTIVWEQPN
jgi:hypothetical protein